MSSSSRGYETFEHTADIGIRAWGKEFSDVFEEAAKALFSVIVELNTVSPRQKSTLQLSAESGEDLFLKWLKELLYLSAVQHLVFCEFKIVNLNSAALSAEAYGEPFDSSKHALGREVKAVTLHQFKFTNEKGRYMAEVILDI